MDSNLIALWVLTGFALATWVMMHIWLPDPPPFNAGKYIGILLAGAIGAVAAGYLVHSRATEGLAGLIAPAAGGLLLSGLAGFIMGGKSAH